MQPTDTKPVSLRIPFGGALLLAPVCLAMLASTGCESRSNLFKCAVDNSQCEGTDSASSGSSTYEPSDSGEPEMCINDDDCTAEDEGDVGPTEMPFFRGTVCMPTAVQPGDSIPLSLAACIHPCLDNPAFQYKTTGRCTTEEDMSVTCEAAPLLWFNEVTGNACPSDVYGKFNKSLCQWKNPVHLTLNPLTIGGSPYSGDANVLIPFLTNDDATAIKNGSQSSTELFNLFATHTQDSGRYLPVSFSDSNPPAPADCKAEGTCNCMDVGF